MTFRLKQSPPSGKEIRSRRSRFCDKRTTTISKRHQSRAHSPSEAEVQRTWPPAPNLKKMRPVDLPHNKPDNVTLG